MSKQKDQVSNLLAAIKRQPTSGAASPAETDATLTTSPTLEETFRQPASKSVRPSKKMKSIHGMPVQFWLHDEDRKTIRELAAWLAGQGLRTSDSQVLRAVLRLAKTGNPLLEAYREASRLDGRRKAE